MSAAPFRYPWPPMRAKTPAVSERMSVAEIERTDAEVCAAIRHAAAPRPILRPLAELATLSERPNMHRWARDIGRKPNTLLTWYARRGVCAGRVVRELRQVRAIALLATGRVVLDQAAMQVGYASGNALQRSLGKLMDDCRALDWRTELEAILSAVRQ